MDYGTRNKVVGDAAKLIGAQGAQSRRQRRAIANRDQQMDFNVGVYQTALLVHNVVEWNGPGIAAEQ